jgi:hypothetical protein
VSLVCGSCSEQEKASVENVDPGLQASKGRERERAEAAHPEALSTGCGVSLADRLVVAVKLLLGGVGVERRGRLIKDMSTTINQAPGWSSGRNRR